MTSKIRDLEEFRERHHVFEDRTHAGKILAAMVQADDHFKGEGIILAIPSGGVPVGVAMGAALSLPVALLIVRKLQIPGNREAGFGAMTLDGTTFFNEPLLAQLRLTDAQIEREKRRVAEELEKRNRRFRQGRPFPDLTDRTVILVDDGLASGFTMWAGLHMAQKKGARKRLVAVPTAPRHTIERLLPDLDRIYCANIRSTPRFSVAAAYQQWYDLSEAEVLGMLLNKPERQNPRENRV